MNDRREATRALGVGNPLMRDDAAGPRHNAPCLHYLHDRTMVLLEFAMAPGGKGESLSPYVARILDVIDKSGVPYQLTPMGTILEGDFDAVMAVVRDCFRALEGDCTRIGMNLKMDYRAGSASRLESKIAHIEQHLGRKLKT